MVAEALFDPTVTGSGIGGTTTLGPIKWEDGRVEFTPNLSVTGLVLDFIGLDGTVSLFLKVADATTTGSTLSWPVASQPWEDGDKLMVRLYQATETTCAETTFGACVLASSPASYAFSVSEDAAVGHAVGTVSATSPTAGKGSLGATPMFV